MFGRRAPISLHSTRLGHVRFQRDRAAHDIQIAVVTLMNTGEICNREVVVAYRHTTLEEAARLMREQHVGSLVVVVDRASERVPVGILTDRDIVLSVVASDPDHLSFLSVSDAMSDDLLAAVEDTTLPDALKLMQERGVRRLPVVDQVGTLVGIVTADDVIRFLADELNQVVNLMSHEEHTERQSRV